MRDSAVVIESPARRGRWIVGAGCCSPPSYHRAATLPVNGAFHAPERFAIDFVQLNTKGQLVLGARSMSCRATSTSAPRSMSVADGVVVGLPGRPARADAAEPPDGCHSADRRRQLPRRRHRPRTVRVLCPHAARQPSGPSSASGSGEAQVLGRLGNTGNCVVPTCTST